LIESGKLTSPQSSPTDDPTTTPIHAPIANSAFVEFNPDSMLSIPTTGLFPYGLPTPPGSCKSVPLESEKDVTTLQYDPGWNFDTLFQRDPLLDTNVGWSSNDLQMMGFGMDNSNASAHGLPFGFDFGM